MFEVKSGWRLLIAVITVGVFTQICGLKIIHDACIDVCSCENMQVTRDYTPKEKRALQVCGTDNVTYESLCKLLCENCINNITLEGRWKNASQIRMSFRDCNRTKEVPEYWKKLWRPKTPKPTVPTGSTTTTTTKKPKRTQPTTEYWGPSTTETPLCGPPENAWIKAGELYKKGFKNITYPIKMLHLGGCAKKKKDHMDSKKYDKIIDNVENLEKMTDKITKRSALYSDELNYEECKGRCSCSYVRNYVCGSNGKTYHNKCKLRCAACEKGIVIKVIHRGKCHSHL